MRPSSSRFRGAGKTTLFRCIAELISPTAGRIRALRSEEDSLAPWEQQAVEEILPLFQAEAANTVRAIGSFNENQELLWTEANRKYADRVSQDSEQIAQIAENCLKYEKLREQEIQLEERISANSGE